MPHKVPQNIDIEDKVIGPLTLQQFIYLMIGSGLIFILNFVLTDSVRFLFFPLSILITAFFGALAFYKPSDRSFAVLLGSAITSLTRPNKRVWKKLPYSVATKNIVVKKEEPTTEKHVSKMDLRRLAFIVDSGGFEDELKGRGIVSSISEQKKLEESTEKLEDTLAATEEKREDLTDLISKAVEKVKARKKEPTLSEIATINPSKEFKYEKLSAIGGVVTEYEEILQKSKELQGQRFKTAQVVKS